MNLILLPSKLIFLTFSLNNIQCEENVVVTTTEQSLSGNRDGKFFSFFHNFLQKQPSNRQKYEDTSNYNQYFTQPDPYNQNQLLNSVSSSGSHSIRPLPTPTSTSFETSENPIDSLNSLFSKLIGNDISSTSSIISNILTLGTSSMENIFNRINKFDSLKCIPRLLCQTIAQRQLEVTTTPITKNNSTIKPKDFYIDGKTIKFQGVETALEQFMAFLDLVQLKDWSLYPYLKGAYEGAQVKRLDECAERFRTCPFSDQQLVYYFNNYNGGFFQSLRSD